MRKLSDDYLDFNIVRARNKKTGEFVLIKEISKETILSNPIYEKIFYKEINLMKLINSENFVKFLEFYENSTHYFIVTEYFEGKILENFLNTRRSLSENLVEKIVKKIAPALKYLDENNLLLDFISPKSFCFKYFYNEDNFDIKFFDYGLSSVFVDDVERKNYLLLDTEYGNVISKKSNVVSFGILIYKLLFGETIYKFSKNEDPQEALKKKSFKLPKNISKRCIKLIERSCHQNVNKRYDWKGLLEDPFIKIKAKEDTQKLDLPSLKSIHTKIEDDKIEKFGDLITEKVEFIIKFYSNILEDDGLEILQYNQFANEIIMALDLYSIELKYFVEFLKPKDRFREDEELHFLILNSGNNINDNNEDSNKNNFNYLYCNFLADKIFFNFENPSLDLLGKNLLKLDEDLEFLKTKFSEKLKSQKISNKESNIEDINSPYPQTKINNNLPNNSTLKIIQNSNEIEVIDKNSEKDIEKNSSANLENYFSAIMEKGIIFCLRNEYKEAFPVFNIAKFLLEEIIFIRLILENIQNIGITDDESKVFDKEKFLKFLNIIDMDNEIDFCNDENRNIREKNKENYSRLIKDNFLMFTFIGGFIKKFYEKNIIVNKSIKDSSNEKPNEIDNKKNINHENTINKRNLDKNKASSSKNFNKLILFYKDLVNLISETARKNNYA